MLQKEKEDEEEKYSECSSIQDWIPDWEDEEEGFSECSCVWLGGQFDSTDQSRESLKPKEQEKDEVIEEEEQEEEEGERERKVEEQGNRTGVTETPCCVPPIPAPSPTQQNSASTQPAAEEAHVVERSEGRPVLCPQTHSPHKRRLLLPTSLLPHMMLSQRLQRMKKGRMRERRRLMCSKRRKRRRRRDAVNAETSKTRSQTGRTRKRALVSGAAYGWEGSLFPLTRAENL